MNKQSTKLLPFIQFDEVDVYNMYAFDGFTEKGVFVKVSEANVDDAIGVIGGAGVVLDGTLSPMWGSKLKIVACASGDKAANVLGVTLKNCLQYDENGELLKFRKQKRIELDSVNSGEAIPVLAEATVLTLGTGAYLVTGLVPALAGTAPAVGHFLVAADAGKVNVVSAAPAADLTLGTVIGLTYQFGGTGIVVRFKK